MIVPIFERVSHKFDNDYNIRQVMLLNYKIVEYFLFYIRQHLYTNIRIHRKKNKENFNY